jgi:hypothetical protein
MPISATEPMLYFQKYSQVAAIVGFGQQNAFANAVAQPVDSVVPTRPEISQYIAEFLLSRPLFASVGCDQKLAPRSELANSAIQMDLSCVAPQ